MTQNARAAVFSPFALQSIRRLALAAVSTGFAATAVLGSGVDLRPSGRVLFQPQLLWSNSMSTVEGTGYIIEHAGKFFGITSIAHFDFNAEGLGSATWLDVHTERPLATFRTSLGRPLRTAITQPRHVADDFLVLPCASLPEGTVALQLENIERYETGTRLWFAQKNREFEAGHDWADAVVVEDLGYLIKARLRDALATESQSGSPVLNAETGKLIGMASRSEDVAGRTVLTICPARSIVKFLRRPQKLTPLLTSINRRR